MSGQVSAWARTRAVINETGGELWLVVPSICDDDPDDDEDIEHFGFDGNRPRRPFSESVLTTCKNKYKHFY
jgi:hypothetical protein